MQQVIRFEGARNMFGVGRVDDTHIEVRVPERIGAQGVIDFLANTRVTPNARLSDIEQCAPRASEDRRGNHYVAVSARMTERRPDFLNDHAVSTALELEFNPAAKPWQANYAGRVRDHADTELFVVGEGDSPNLADFLESQPEITSLNPIPALENTHFEIQGSDAQVEASAAALPKTYSRYIAAFVADQLGYRP